MSDNEVAAVGSMSQDEKFDSASSKKEVNDWKKNLEQKSSEVSSSPRIGLDHFMQEPVGTERNLHIADHEIVLSRLMMEKWGSPRHDLIFDKLSESEKQKLIANLVNIQNDGTVEVNLEKGVPVASELLKLQSFHESTMSGTIIPGPKKSAPLLQIVILVVGTRGDVQPFLAIARKLQEYGHRVRLATHADFDTFVKSAGIDFYPLGGDPRALAGSC